MNQKTLFVALLLIGFIFIPVAKISATQVYVGVQIQSANAPGYNDGTNPPMTDNNWCLPANSSIGILSTAQYNYLTSNYDATSLCGPSGYCSTACPVSASIATSRVCAGNTIYSGLVNLTNGSNYKVYLYTPSFCPGYANGACYVTTLANKNCCDVCSNYGLTAMGGETNCSSSNCSDYNVYYDDSNCSIEATLKGSACSVCNTGATYSYFSGNNCWTTYGGSSYYPACSWSSSGLTRVCTCNADTGTPTGFVFPFTANF